MDNVKKLDALIMKATSQSLEQIPQALLNQILQLVNSRADMPKNVINSISKRMVVKSKRALINIFIILEYLGYQCELSLYSQISTKQFLFKISGMLMNKDIDPVVKIKIMETIYCWEQLFRPHEDLLPLFFQFYAGLLRNNFDIPHDYKSKFRPAQLKQYKKPQQKLSTTTGQKPAVQKPIPTITEKKTFEQIREKLILTNQIIDNANPADNVKQNGLLLQMIQQLKQCEKKINKTITQNSNQTILELALAANDDIVTTYGRFKTLQRNRRPDPFILTELASDVLKQQQQMKKKSSTNQNQVQKVNNQVKKQTNLFDIIQDEPQKIQKKNPPKQANLFDLDFQPQGPPKKQQPKGNIFDLLGDNTVPQNVAQIPPQNTNNFDIFSQQNKSTIQNSNSSNANNLSNLGNFEDLLKTGSYQPIPAPSGNGITLNVNDFMTENDFKKDNKNKTLDRLDQLTSDFLNK